MKVKVFTPAKNITFENFVDNGFQLYNFEADEEENTVFANKIYFKKVPQQNSSGLVAFVVNIFNNPDWQMANLNLEVIEMFKDKGVEFKVNKNGYREILMNDNFFKYATNWKLEIDFSEEPPMLGLTLDDLSFPILLCNADILNTYCPEEIKELIDLKLIKKIKVSE